MKHATPAALDQLEHLLADLRGLPGLSERSRGVFYRKGRAFLHFREDAAGLFADIRDETGADFQRLDITKEPGRTRLLEMAMRRSA